MFAAVWKCAASYQHNVHQLRLRKEQEQQQQHWIACPGWHDCRYWGDMGVDGLIAAERSGDGYVVSGNVVLNARGRGLALGAAGLARGNTIAHPKYWGIQVRPRSGDAGHVLQHINTCGRPCGS